MDNEKLARMRKGYGPLSAGTKVALLSTDEKIGIARVKTLSPSSHKIPSRIETDVPLEYLEPAKSHTYIVPVLNSKARRRKAKAVMANLKAMPQEMEKK